MTAIIKTFERPESLQRLMSSLRLRYPRLKVIVADDSHVSTPVPDVQLLRLPFDVGISHGRNRLLDCVTTPYFLLLDDDYIFEGGTCIEKLLRALETDPSLALAAGRKRFLQSPHRPCWYGRMFLERGVLRLERDFYRSNSDVQVGDITCNFFVGRTEVIRGLRWDDAIKTSGEHLEFFVRFHQQGMFAAYIPEVTIIESNARPAVYRHFRSRDYWDQAMRKHGIERVIFFDGSQRVVRSGDAEAS